jgi:hypothetical protein
MTDGLDYGDGLRMDDSTRLVPCRWSFVFLSYDGCVVLLLVLSFSAMALWARWMIPQMPDTPVRLTRWSEYLSLA